MNLSTVARIKALRPIDPSETSQDAILETILAGVSNRFERWMARHVESKVRTETERVRQWKRTLWLEGFPVTSVASVRYGSNPNTLADEDPLDATDDYFVEPSTGILELLRGTSLERGWLQVTYTGGMAATPAAFITAYPEIAAACDQQVLHEFLRRASPGGKVHKFEGGGSEFDDELGLLKTAKEVLEAHRRRPW